MEKRKAFNFFHSYYDVAKELSDQDKLKFLWAILQKQFEGIEPKLKGQSNFAYISQKHSIDSQVIGYEHKTGQKLVPYVGGSVGGSVQGEGKGKVEVQYVIDFPKLLSFINSTLGKKFQVINDSVREKYNARAKDGYTKEQIIASIINASKDKFHQETGYKWLTPEYFSRSATIDKYGFVSSVVNPGEDKRVFIPLDSN